MSWWWTVTTDVPLPLRRIGDLTAGRIMCLISGHEYDGRYPDCCWCGKAAGKGRWMR